MNNTIPIEELRKEIAHHEASHFIIGLLVNKESNHFKQPTNITFCVKEKEKFLANVYTSYPFWDENEPIIPKDFLKEAYDFYSKEYNVYLECLKRLAGFASCKIFMNKPDKFIHYLQFSPETILRSDVPVDYFDYSSFWCSSYFKNVNNLHDFKQVSMRLSRHLELNFDRQYEFIKVIIEQLCSIISVEKIKLSIEFVTQKLIEKECTKIELEEIEKIKTDVLSNIDDFKLTQYLSKIEEAKKQLTTD